ncbi:TRAP transporter substrate-binding protein DctP [Thermodesulfobacteriota bacterium]
MKKFAMAIAVVLLLVFAGSVSAEPIILKYAQFEPSNKAFAMREIWLPWVEKLNKEGEGLFKIEVYVGGTLNRVPPKQLKICRDGVADIVFTLPSYTPGIFADDSVVEVPFVANRALEAGIASHRMLEKGLLRNYDVIVPLMLSAGQQYAIHSTFPVKRPGDLKGKKIRATGKMQHYMAKAFGAAPIGMPVTKIAESMSRGLIQATTNEWNAVRTFKIGDIARYHCMLPLGTVTFLVAMNKNSFNRLPKKAQDIFIRNREYTMRLWAGKMDEALDKYYEKLKTDPKHHIFIPTAAETEEWQKVLGPAVEAWMKDDPKRKGLLETYKAEIAKARGGM